MLAIDNQKQLEPAKANWVEIAIGITVAVPISRKQFYGIEMFKSWHSCSHREKQWFSQTFLWDKKKNPVWSG